MTVHDGGGCDETKWTEPALDRVLWRGDNIVVSRTVSKQRLCKHVPVATDEVPLETVLEPGSRGIVIIKAVTRKHLVRTLRAGKYLACALVNCKVWKLAMAL
jgi:hypothetical protein